jgi:cyclopropane-fatty-acyl-phospholipid synthase
LSLSLAHHILDHGFGGLVLAHDEVMNDRWSYSLTFKQWALNLEANKDYVQRTFGDFEFRKFRLFLWGGVYEFLARNRDCYRLSIYKPTLPK